MKNYLSSISNAIPQGIKNLSSDFVLNLCASFVSTGVLQLLVYPRLAISLGAEGYGEMLTIMGFVNIIILSLGNNLCNARIVQQPLYRNAGIVGDFQLIAVFAAVISGILVVAANAYFKLNIYILVGLLLATAFHVLRSYYLAAYRIDINYKKNLWANIITAIGYVIGAYILLNILGWPIVFLLSAILCLVYIWFTSPIMKEPYKKTKFFGKTSNTVLMLLISGIVGNVTAYLDRFLLFPTLGAESVSTYTTAAFFAKSMSLVLLPLTSVILTYLSAGRIKINQRRFLLINGIIAGGALVFFVVSITLGQWITQLLYPSLIDMAKPYLVLASIGVIISISCSFTSVVLLALAPTFWQAVLASSKLVFRLLLGIIMIKSFGLYGLCLSIVILNFIHFVTIYVICNYYIKKESV